MIRPLDLARDCILMSVAITLALLNNPAKSEELQNPVQDTVNVLISSNELIYDKTLNKYILLGNVLIKCGKTNIKSDSIILYSNDSVEFGNKAINENVSNKILANFCDFNQYSLTIESHKIKYDIAKNELKIKDIVIKNMDYKTPLNYVTAPTMIINMNDWTFKAYGKDNNNKVRMVISSMSDVKNFEINK